MIRLVTWVMAIALGLGVATSIADLTSKMAKAAVHAHQSDQMSYAKFTRALQEAKPRQKKETGSK